MFSFFKKKKTPNNSFHGIEIRTDDVFLASYPKSGNTWTRFLIAHLLKKEPVKYSELETFIPSMYRSLEKINQAKSRRIIKTHHADISNLPKVLYIVRDGRDALVSYYHFFQDTKNFKGTFEDFYWHKKNTAIGEWGIHVKKAFEFQSKNPSKILVIKYESLLMDTAMLLSQIADFLSVPYNDDIINFSVQQSSFGQLKKKQEQQEGIDIDGKKVNFFRKGTSNQWQGYFKEKELNHFYSTNKNVLTRLGYE